MAKANPNLIKAIRTTARNLQNGAEYQWGHMGKCNCGHLARELTPYSAAEIHEYAIRIKRGAWADQEADFCPQSKLPMDMLISSLLNAGLETKDFHHIEELSDPKVLATRPLGQKFFSRNNRQDVIEYLTIWADILENELLEEIELPTDLLETPSDVISHPKSEVVLTV